MFDYIAFLSCLEFALLNSVYKGIILKPKQVLCLESAYLEKDVMCVLPTGYGKSLIFHLLPMLIFAKYKLRSDVLGWRSKAISTVVNTIVIVVSPLNSLMSDQISRLNMSGIQASVIGVKESRGDENMANSFDKNYMDDEFNVDVDFRFCQEKKLRDGQYHIVFAYPESLISSKYGRELLLSEKYRDNVVAIVIDEVHCIVDWLVYITLFKLLFQP
jgi:superfamily II DNA helicase RecQ